MPNKLPIINIPELPDSVDNALKNLSDEPTKNIGHTFGDIWYLVFGGISQAADKRRMKYAAELEQYHQELSLAIEQIPDTKKISPSIQVTAQALENSKYCVSSEVLRNMFVKLISGTMNHDFESHIHPSFPETIKQMSENDALFIKAMKKHKDIPIATIGLNYQQGGFHVSVKDVCVIPGLQLSIEECCVSMSALVKFGFLETTYTEWFSDDSSYSLIRGTSCYSAIDAKSKTTGRDVHFKKGICRLTPLGSEFVISCVV